MKPIDVKGNAFIDSSKEVNSKDPKFKVGNHVKMSKYKSIFGKGYTSNWSEEIFVIKEVKKARFHGHMLSIILMVRKLREYFSKKKLQKTNQEEFRIKKVIKRKESKCQI